MVNPIILRTQEARKASSFSTQTEIAEALGITRDTYATYETRSLIAHDLLAPFCKKTDTNIIWLLTGEGPMKYKYNKFMDTMAKVNDTVLQNELEIIVLREIVDKKLT